MFGRRQQREKEDLGKALMELKKEVEQQYKQYEAQAEALKEQSGALQEIGQGLAACREQTDLSGRDIGRQLKRHSEAIEDLLEQQGTQETVIERYENQIREGRERENMLLNLLCRYQEELWLIEEKLRDMDLQHAEDWTDQLSLFRKSLENELRQCAIEETGRPGESVDYRYHEILDVEDTDETALDSTVAHCYRPGCIYHGKVAVKAQIRAYRVTAKKS